MKVSESNVNDVRWGLTLLENHSEDGNEDSLAEGLVGEQRSVIVESELQVVHEASRLELRELGP